MVGGSLPYVRTVRNIPYSTELHPRFKPHTGSTSQESRLRVSPARHPRIHPRTPPNSTHKKTMTAITSMILAVRLEWIKWWNWWIFARNVSIATRRSVCNDAKQVSVARIRCSDTSSTRRPTRVATARNQPGEIALATTTIIAIATATARCHQGVAACNAIDLDAFTGILWSKSVCVWGGCYRPENWVKAEKSISSCLTIRESFERSIV
jgi:hypothetical protein